MVTIPVKILLVNPSYLLPPVNPLARVTLAPCEQVHALEARRGSANLETGRPDWKASRANVLGKSRDRSCNSLIGKRLGLAIL